MIINPYPLPRAPCPVLLPLSACSLLLTFALAPCPCPWPLATCPCHCPLLLAPCPWSVLLLLKIKKTPRIHLALNYKNAGWQIKGEETFYLCPLILNIEKKYWLARFRGEELFRQVRMKENLRTKLRNESLKDKSFKLSISAHKSKRFSKTFLILIFNFTLHSQYTKSRNVFHFQISISHWAREYFSSRYGTLKGYLSLLLTLWKPKLS